MTEQTDTSVKWLTRGQVSERLQIPYQTIANWGSEGKGPRFAKFGRHVRYRLDQLEAWEEQQFGAAS